MRRYLPFAIIVAVFVIAIGSALLLLRWKQPVAAPTAPVPSVVPVASTPIVPAATPIVPTAPPTVPIAKDDAPARREANALHFRGGANAPVTLEEFGDFQCVPCAELFPKLAKVEEDYGEKLRVVFRHYPLRKHEHGVLAARAAEAAGLQGQFWEMHDLLFQNSSRWTKGVDTVGPDASPSQRLQSKILAMEIEVRDVFYTYAQRLKLDVERFKADLDNNEVKARVESDRAHGETLGLDRTPTLYLNGRLLPFAASRTAESLHAEIDVELNAKGKGAAASSAQTATPEQAK
jgi:protein-disulfide isomerase